MVGGLDTVHRDVVRFTSDVNNKSLIARPQDVDRAIVWRLQWAPVCVVLDENELRRANVGWNPGLGAPGNLRGSEVNWGPWSEERSDGAPNWATQVPMNACATSAVVVDASRTTFGHLAVLSTMVRKTLRISSAKAA
ncbi:hypothetical protein AAFF_G00103260 [Aldrovandia affinis]|uniref:Uncharacterized protein n=1 Tax=Aldrovandia affinis TaxID=143900 RepID=A0AAD7RUA1_9TELE|nr:hypothetical protein AAFF_G00103260 [Aldrovandia affinis]